MAPSASIVRLLAAAVLALCTSAGAAEQDLSINARLLLAARSGDTASLDSALQSGAAADARNRLGETARLGALKRGDAAMASLRMLEAGTDVNLAAVNGVTPLMAAAFTGQAEMAHLLLAKGADVSALDRLDKSAMTYAAGTGHTEAS